MWMLPALTKISRTDARLHCREISSSSSFLNPKRLRAVQEQRCASPKGRTVTEALCQQTVAAEGCSAASARVSSVHTAPLSMATHLVGSV